MKDYIETRKNMTAGATFQIFQDAVYQIARLATNDYVPKEYKKELDDMIVRLHEMGEGTMAVMLMKKKEDDDDKLNKKLKEIAERHRETLEALAKDDECDSGKTLEEGKLKPCPFCGTPAKLYSEPTIYGPDRPAWYVKCGSSLCWAQTRSFGVQEQAIRTWNKRADE